ncbi:YibE/F-like [Syntrophomonas zehnderi OL-4]|uniref:YibE/F-like n=1 Tax=Syntrophomonas zehnderi OL-4 TaxID=690567 RepID=A0A0E4GDH4_9FIRM|nr:YibE/F-like [Syntrophomonas zehnderi OL-4]
MYSIRYGFIWLTLFIILVFSQSSEAAVPTAASLTSEQDQIIERYEEAKVLELEEIGEIKFEEQNGRIIEQAVKVEILSGPFKGREFIAHNSLSNSPGIDIEINEGDRVVVYMSEKLNSGKENEIQEVYVADIGRTNYLTYLLLAFILLLIGIGGKKGIQALVALGLTVLGIWKVLLPAILKGHSPLPLTVLVIAAVTILTMIVIGGITRKSLAATLGTITGVLIAGILAILVGDLAHLNGLATEEERMLLYVEGLKINMQGLLFAGILIGAVGAIMDVAMSVASAVEEVKKANPALSRMQLVSAGMNVGKDIMGTMANTLILAYAGGSLPFMLLYLAYDTPVVRVFNSELIATEIVRSLAGTIGLIICVPLTAIIAGFLAGRGQDVP